ncbi:MAG: hypothetical protein ACQES4_06530 [Bacillota bacterium]
MKAGEKLKNYIDNRFSPNQLPPRGEIWVEPQVLKSKGLPNDATGITNFAAQIGADYCFFSCSGAQPVGSKRSDLSKAVKKARSLGLACGAVIDGPWQKLACQDGLMPLLQKLISKPSKLKILSPISPGWHGMNWQNVLNQG